MTERIHPSPPPDDRESGEEQEHHGSIEDILRIGDELGVEPVVEIEGTESKVIDSVRDLETGEHHLLSLPQRDIGGGCAVFDPEESRIHSVQEGEQLSARFGVPRSVSSAVQSSLDRVRVYMNEKDPLFLRRFVLANTLLASLALASTISRKVLLLPWPLPHWDKASDLFFANFMIAGAQTPLDAARRFTLVDFFRQMRDIDSQKAGVRFDVRNSKIATGYTVGVFVVGEFLAKFAPVHGAVFDPLDIVAFCIGGAESHWLNTQLIRRFQPARMHDIQGVAINHLQTRFGSESLRGELGVSDLKSLVRTLNSRTTKQDIKDETIGRILDTYEKVLSEVVAILRRESSDIEELVRKDPRKHAEYLRLTRSWGSHLLRTYIHDNLKRIGVDKEFWNQSSAKSLAHKDRALSAYRLAQ